MTDRQPIIPNEAIETGTLDPTHSLDIAARFVAACVMAQNADLLDYLEEPDLSHAEAGIIGIRTTRGTIWARVAFLADTLAGAPKPDGPYRPELAAAFRDAARDMPDLPLDRYEVPEMALVEEGEGGAWITARVFVADDERPALREEGPVFEGFAEWTVADQSEAQRDGWELTQYGAGDICIIASDSGDAPPAFSGEAANTAAAEHVRQFAISPHVSDDYRMLCERALATVAASGGRK